MSSSKKESKKSPQNGPPVDQVKKQKAVQQPKKESESNIKSIDYSKNQKGTNNQTSKKQGKNQQTKQDQSKGKEGNKQPASNKKVQGNQNGKQKQKTQQTQKPQEKAFQQTSNFTVQESTHSKATARKLQKSAEKASHIGDQKRRHDEFDEGDDVLKMSGILDAYEHFLKTLCKYGLPTGDVYEFAAQQIQKFERKKRAKQLKLKAQMQIQKAARKKEQMQKQKQHKKLTKL